MDEASMTVGMKRAFFENLSTAMRIASYPCDFGRGPIRSIEIT